MESADCPAKRGLAPNMETSSSQEVGDRAPLDLCRTSPLASGSWDFLRPRTNPVAVKADSALGSPAKLAACAQ